MKFRLTLPNTASPHSAALLVTDSELGVLSSFGRPTPIPYDHRVAGECCPDRHASWPPTSSRGQVSYRVGSSRLLFDIHPSNHEITCTLLLTQRDHNQWR